jgi:lysophospholipase L1-like esterase
MPDTITPLVSDSLSSAAALLPNSFNTTTSANSGGSQFLSLSQPIAKGASEAIELSKTEEPQTLPLPNSGIIPLNDSEIAAVTDLASQSIDRPVLNQNDDLPTPVLRDITGIGVNSIGSDSLLAQVTDPFAAQTTSSYIANTNSKSLLFSPYNWLPVNNGIQTSDAGAYLKFKFNGTQATLKVDTSSQTSFPLLDVFVDGKQTGDQLWLKNATNGQVKLFAGNAGNHEVTVYFRRRELYDDNNPAVVAIKQQDWLTDAEHWRVTGVEVSGGKGFLKNTLAKSKTAVFFGDSITEGYAQYFDPISPPDRPSTITTPTIRNSISYKTYAAQLGALLNVDYGQIGWSGSGWVQPTTITGNPPILDSWLNYNGSSTTQRAFKPQPDYVFINLGTNDGAFNITDTVTSWLTKARQTIPAAEIFVITPFNQSKSTELSQAIARYRALNPTDTKIHSLDLGAEGARGLGAISIPTLSVDQIHPTINRSQQLAGLLYDQIRPIIGITGTTIQSANISAFTALNNVQYSGSWQNISSKGTPNSIYTSDQQNATYEVKFWGDHARLFGSKGNNEGIAAISIDGGTEILTDLYSNKSRNNALLFNADNLDHGLHTIKVRVTGKKNIRSIGTSINLGKLRIW